MEQCRFINVKLFVLVGLMSLGAAACSAPTTALGPTAAPGVTSTLIVILDGSVPGVTSTPEATLDGGALAIEPRIATLQSVVYPPETRTGFPELDVIIDAVLAHDVVGLRDLTQYTQVGCTHADGLGGPPKCLEGEDENTLVDVVPFLGSEGSHQRRVDYELWSGPDVSGLLAAYRVSSTVFSEEAYPAGEYALVFLDARGIAHITLHVRKGRVVRYDYGIPGSLQSDLENGSSEIILPLSHNPIPAAMPWN